MSRYKENVVPALIAVALVAYIWPISVSTELTNSGKIAFFVSDLIVLIVCACNFAVYIKNRIVYNANKVIKTVEWAYIAILAIYGIVVMYRLANNLYVYQSFDACFRTLAPLSLGLFILKDRRTYKVWLRWINYTITFINVYSTIYHLCVYKQLRSDFLLNVNMLAFVCVVGLFVNSLAFKNSEKKVIHSIIFIFNIVYNVTVFCVIGSRSAVFMGVLACITVLSCFASRKKIKHYVIAGGLTIGVILIFWATDFGYCRSLMMRGFNLTTIAESVENSRNEGGQNEETENKEDTKGEEDEKFVEEGLKESDSIRLSCWKSAIQEIGKNPMFGTGKVGVYESKDGFQSAHNFVLEYVLIYGVVGFIVWVVFVVIYLAIIIRKTDKGMRRRIIFGLFGLLCTTLGFSFFQVTMTTTLGSLVVWIAVFLYSASIIYDEE